MGKSSGFKELLPETASEGTCKHLWQVGPKCTLSMSKICMRSISLTQNTETCIIVGMLTAKTGPDAGNYAGQYASDPGERSVVKRVSE